MTPEEEAQLLRLAERERVSIPRLLVESTLAQRQGETPTQRRDAITTLFALHRLLAGIANNVNQMTATLHSKGQLPPQTGEVLTAVRRTAERIDAAIDELST